MFFCMGCNVQGFDESLNLAPLESVLHDDVRGDSRKEVALGYETRKGKGVASDRRERGT